MRITPRLGAPMPLMKLPAHFATPTRVPSPPIRSANPFLDRTVLFHGMGLHLPRVKSVLANGIVSQQGGKRTGVPIVPNFAGGGYNGESKIYLSAYEGPRFSFGAFSAGKLSIIVEGAGLDVEAGTLSGYSDERMVAGVIPPHLFRGLLVPTALLDEPLHKLRVGLMMGPTTNASAAISAYIQAIKNECGHTEANTQLLEGVGVYTGLDLQEKYSPYGRDLEKWIEYKLALFTQRAYAHKLQAADGDVTLRRALRATLPATTKLYGPDGTNIAI